MTYYLYCPVLGAIFIEFRKAFGFSAQSMVENENGEFIVNIPYEQIILTPLCKIKKQYKQRQDHHDAFIGAQTRANLRHDLGTPQHAARGS